jgi:hypothetical protein
MFTPGRFRGHALVLFAALMALTATAKAQQVQADPDSARADIRTTLRAFYFSLAHTDWEALTADILAAKVVAHLPAPEALVAAANSPRRAAGPSSPGDDPVPCLPTPTALVDQAVVTLDGDWAEVTVPRCTGTTGGADEFRLIRFEGRWRFVYIDLFREQ